MALGTVKGLALDHGLDLDLDLDRVVVEDEG